ncbi:MAG: hypothetical protein J0G95_00420 [Rhizobiales bacterium]|nr:hypothetical protein [Hyphomicrobiales bacterium]
MSKFRIKFKLQSLELEIEGSREDASAISQNIGAQLSSIIQPAAGIIDGELVHDSSPTIQSPPIAIPTNRRSRRRKSLGSTPDSDVSGAIDFILDPSKYSTPKQQWKTADKAIWLIHVLQDQGKGTEFSTKTLVETFNKHFKQSGTITTSNVTRDLGRLKANSRPSLIGENTTNSPSTWFLTDEGVKRAHALITEALNDSR